MNFANFRRITAGSLPSIPHLWSEAKRLFARALANTGEAAEIAKRGQLSRTRRRDIVLWIEPVEKMVRNLILARAAIHLLMTPEGRKLLRESKRDYPPPDIEEDLETDPEPPKPKSVSYSRRIPHPGWHTIWQPPEKPAPPMPAPVASPQPEETQAPDLGDPASWSCPYRVVSRTPAAQPSVVCEPEPLRRPRITLLETEWITPLPPKPPTPPAPMASSDPDDEDASGSKLAFRYARRIEALRRVIENPEPAIRRLARILARLAPDDLDMPRWRNDAARRRWQSWRQGDLYADQAREHAMLALRALHLSLEWLDRPDDEPG